MHLGLFLEFDKREGHSEAEAFGEGFCQIELAEKVGLHSVWLAENHFQPRRSVLSVPMAIASATAACTRRLRVGIGVQVLPLVHPVRLAEEAATVDQISGGRLELGIGRSAFTSAYEGYGIPYPESRGRFRECLDILVRAWTEEEFSYEGEHYRFHKVHLCPRPYQQPYPPLRMAATSSETFSLVGRMGLPIFVGLRSTGLEELTGQIEEYRREWRRQGHQGDPDVALRLPVYVAEREEEAISHPREGTMAFFRRLAERYATEGGSPGAQVEERARKLGELTYERVLAEKVAFGTPGVVLERLLELKEHLGLSSIMAEVNPGASLPSDRILGSIRLLGEEVLPRLG